MKKLLFAAVLAVPVALQAQTTLTSDLVEGGKTLVELIRVLKEPRIVTVAAGTPATVTYIDSCSVKQLGDISFKNKTDETVQVSMFLRIGNVYAATPLYLTLSAMTQESLYSLKVGIYKYKIEIGEVDDKITLHEGELKLEPCDKLIREIK